MSKVRVIHAPDVLSDSREQGTAERLHRLSLLYRMRSSIQNQNRINQSKRTLTPFFINLGLERRRDLNPHDPDFAWGLDY